MRSAIITGLTLLLCVTTLPAQNVSQTEELLFEPVQVVSTAEANYPPNTIMAGTVVFEVTVGADGQAERVRTVRDIPPLTQAAERALKQWTFRAATLDGKPVRAAIAVAFTFTRPVLNPARRPQ